MALREVFERYRDSEWVFAAPGGNQGDELIYLGSYKLADEVGLKYEKVTYGRNSSVDAFDNTTIIYLQGGGGFNPWWNWTPWLLRKLREANSKNLIIIGPTTTVNYKEYLDRVLSMDDRMIFFAREQTTYGIMQDYCKDVRIDHDTALNLEFGDNYLDWQLMENYPLLALRADMESTQNIPRLVRVEDYISFDPCKQFKELSDWARLHMQASKIVTDRSHSAIMGAILGKDTSLFAGSYHKNRSIWEYSLKDRGVKWID